MQDLPFSGVGLFSNQTNARLHGLKDARATLRSLGMHMPESVTKPFRSLPPFLLPLTCAAWPGKTPWRPEAGCFEGALESDTPVTSTDPPHLFLNHLPPYHSDWLRLILNSCVTGLYPSVFGPSLPHPSSPSLFRNSSHEQHLIQEINNRLQLEEVEDVPQEIWGERFLLLLFPDPKGKRGPVSHSGPDTNQQVSQEVEVSHGIPGLQHSFPGSGRLERHFFISLSSKGADCSSVLWWASAISSSRSSPLASPRPHRSLQNAWPQ